MTAPSPSPSSSTPADKIDILARARAFCAANRLFSWGPARNSYG